MLDMGVKVQYKINYISLKAKSSSQSLLNPGGIFLITLKALIVLLTAYLQSLETIPWSRRLLNSPW